MGEHLQQLLSSAQAACCFLGGFTPECSICFIPSAEERMKICFSQVCQASRDGVPTRPHCPRTAGGVGDQEGSVKPPAPANLAAEQSWGTPAAARVGPNDLVVQDRGQCLPCGSTLCLGHPADILGISAEDVLGKICSCWAPVLLQVSLGCMSRIPVEDALLWVVT